MPSTATASVASPPPASIASALPSSFSSTSFSTFSSGAGGSQSGAQLRHSSSLANVRSVTSSSPRERRRPSLSVSPSSFHASSLSPDSYTSNFKMGSTDSTASFMSPPPSPPPPNSRLEENYLAVKRRAHRQSYFDHYPERNSPHLREERKAATDELDVLVSARKDKAAKGKERVEFLQNAPPEFAADAKLEIATGRPSQRKSRSTASSSKQKLDTSSSTKAANFREFDFAGQTTALPAPTRPPRSAKRATSHVRPPQTAAATSTATTIATALPSPRIDTTRTTSNTTARSDGHVLRTPKVPTHPYGAFRGDGCPDLRMSNSTYSSSQTHRGSPSPPQTPVEAHSHHPSYEPIEVMVAPVFDVEAMDALVDGMDGSSDDDLFKRLQRTVAKSDFGARHAARENQHHPLYAPPLPEPPEGIVLGRARSRPEGSHSTHVDGRNKRDDSNARTEDVDGGWDDDDEASDDIAQRTSLERKPFPSVAEKQKPRDKNGRTASSSTIIADMMSQSSSSQDTTLGKPLLQTHKADPSPQPVKETPLSIDEIIRKHTSKPAHVPSYQRPSSPIALPSSSASTSASASAERQSTARASSNVPSISEIIQKHMPPDPRRSYSPNSSIAASADTSSISAHGEHHRRPLVLPLRQASSTSSSEADFSYSAGAVFATSASVDSISAEASVQSSNASFSRPQKAAPNLNRRHSTYSGKFANGSWSTNYGGKASSVRSGSASASVSKGTTHTSDNLFSEPDILSGLSANIKGGSSTGGSGRRKPNAQRDAVATYLRSARITTLLKLMKRPHAAPDRPLTVSVSDLGTKSGIPLVVFLGLGCVRHVMGLYDEMAECMGLRLITIDRWGLGRTDAPSSSSCRGVLEWATVVDEVLEQLNVGRCSIMAHSAGSPYALAFANKYPSRIVGDICLLAPWVGGGSAGGYGWLKYVPNGILKTAQAAEWKIQAWMIGKPPKITYEGIGYNMNAPVSSVDYDETEHTDRGAGARAARGFDEEDDDDESGSMSGYDEELDELDLRPDEMGLKIEPLVTASPVTSDPHAPAVRSQRSGSLMGKSRPSTSSGNTLAEYDDLADFGGRFNSRSLERRRSIANEVNGYGGGGFGIGKKKKGGFLNRWKGTPLPGAGISNTPPPPVPPVPAIMTALDPADASSGSASKVAPTQVPTDPLSQGGGKSKLRTLRSIGSLRHRNSNGPSMLPTTSPKVGERSPVLPEQDFSSALDFGLSLDDFGRADRKELDANEPAGGQSLSRKSSDRQKPTMSRRSTMYGEPSAVEGNSDLSIVSSPVPSTRAKGRRSISMSAARPITAPSTRTAAATISGRAHQREQSVSDASGALPSTTSSNSIKTSPSKRVNKLRRRQSAAPRSAADTSSNSNAPSPTSVSSISYQVELGNALIAASHAESSRGTHPDLLQILNHERRPWGFSYARYPHPVHVWYGDRDERIARESVEWMREKMCAKDAIAAGGDGRCEVKVVKGADHGLMFRTDVVVEVLEHVQAMWTADSSGGVSSVASEMNVPSPMFLGVEQERVGLHSLGAKLNLSPRKSTNGVKTSDKGTLRASWGYELQSDPFRAL